jgi:hypothetical protein
MSRADTDDTNNTVGAVAKKKKTKNTNNSKAESMAEDQKTSKNNNASSAFPSVIDGAAARIVPTRPRAPIVLMLRLKLTLKIQMIVDVVRTLFRVRLTG